MFGRSKDTARLEGELGELEVKRTELAAELGRVEVDLEAQRSRLETDVRQAEADAYLGAGNASAAKRTRDEVEAGIRGADAALVRLQSVASELDARIEAKREEIAQARAGDARRDFVAAAKGAQAAARALADRVKEAARDADALSKARDAADAASRRASELGADTSWPEGMDEGDFKAGAEVLRALLEEGPNQPEASLERALTRRRHEERAIFSSVRLWARDHDRGKIERSVAPHLREEAFEVYDVERARLDALRDEAQTRRPEGAFRLRLRA